MPDSVEMPAPVSTTMRSAASTQPRTCSIKVSSFIGVSLSASADRCDGARESAPKCHASTRHRACRDASRAAACCSAARRRRIGVGCTTLRADRAPWQTRLRNDTIALLGEVHDNAALHRLRTDAAAQRVPAGLAARGRDGAVRHRSAGRSGPSPGESGRAMSQYLIEQASGPRSGWTWPNYEAVLALVLEHGLELHAGNLSRGQAARVVREGHGCGLLDSAAPRARSRRRARRRLAAGAGARDRRRPLRRTAAATCCPPWRARSSPAMR